MRHSRAVCVDSKQVGWEVNRGVSKGLGKRHNRGVGGMRCNLLFGSFSVGYSRVLCG